MLLDHICRKHLLSEKKTLNRGRAVLLYWYLWKSGPVIGVFEAYIAHFGGKTGKGFS